MEKKDWQERYGSTLPKIDGVLLLVEELNSPSENSDGCDNMGDYGNWKYCLKRTEVSISRNRGITKLVETK